MEASIVNGFCQGELNNLAQIFHCTVTREPSYGQAEKVSIKEIQQKYSDDVKKCLERINQKLKNVQRGEYKYSEDEFVKVTDFYCRKSEDRNKKTEVYVAKAKSEVIIIGETYDDVQRTLQELKVINFT